MSCAFVLLPDRISRRANRGHLMNKSLRNAFITAIIASFLLAACGSRINQANFDKIKTGMTEEEVKKILGPPTETSSITIAGFSGTSSKWTSKDGTVVIQFFNGKAQMKVFSEGEEQPAKPSKTKANSL